MRTIDTVIPRLVLAPLLMAGTWVAVLVMPHQRDASRSFLTLIRGRRVAWVDVWRHFYAFLTFLMIRLRCSRGRRPTCELREPESAAATDFQHLRGSAEQAFFGTFHFGYSDLLGFLLAGHGRRVTMIRRRIENSEDVRWLEAEFGSALSMVWSNDAVDLPLRLKAAIDAGDSLAIQCDRVEGSSRTIEVPFLGEVRAFPFAIYHLAVLFDRPVVFCLALPRGRHAVEVVTTPIFRVDPQLGRMANLSRAAQHFTGVLQTLETEVRQRPELWFNFEPLASGASRPLP